MKKNYNLIIAILFTLSISFTQQLIPATLAKTIEIEIEIIKTEIKNIETKIQDLEKEIKKFKEKKKDLNEKKEILEKEKEKLENRIIDFTQIIENYSPTVLKNKKMEIVHSFLKDSLDIIQKIIQASNKIDSSISRLIKTEKNLAQKGLSKESITKVIDQKMPQLSKQVLKPVNNFLIPLNKLCGSILRPLIQESLTNAGMENYADSPLYKFFTIKGVEINTFFDNHMKTKKNFIIACNNFKIFFADLEASMPEEFQEAHNLLKAKNG